MVIIEKPCHDDEDDAVPEVVKSTESDLRKKEGGSFEASLKAVFKEVPKHQ